jgi:hypothetical protein
VLLELAEPNFVSAYRIIHDLPTRLRDEKFYREVGEIGLADIGVHEEVYLMRALDRIGTYVKYGLVDGEIIYGSYWARIILTWELLGEVVAIHRKIAGAKVWMNVQFLHDDCKRWLASNHLEYDATTVLARMTDFISSATPEPAIDTKA